MESEKEKERERYRRDNFLRLSTVLFGADRNEKQMATRADKEAHVP